MTKKPTYKELEQRVKELEKEAVRHKRLEQALREREKQYRSIFNAAMDSFLICDCYGRVVEVNPQACKMYGYSYEEFMKLSGKEVVHPDYYHLFEQFLRDVQKTGEFHGESVDVRKDGTPFNIEVRGRRFAYKGKPHLLAVVRDVTEQKRAGEALRKSENKYRTLLEHLPQKIFHKDRNSVYLSCNENYARDLKIKPEEIEGKTDYEFFPRELAKKYRVDDKRIIASGKTEDIQEKYVQDGEEVWVHTVKTPIKDEKGNVTGILGIFWDITQRRRAEQALRAKQAALEVRTSELKEVNTALRVLLKQRDEDKTELEEKLLFNVRKLVVPYAEKLKKTGLDAQQLAYLNVLESNLNDITSPFALKFSLKYLGLTPAEIQTAHLVKSGKTTKEIAELLNVSPLTVESRRKDIRTKLGIRNKKASLRSQLLSI